MLKLSFEDINQRTFSLLDLKTLPRHPVYVVCENIRSLYNVGSIFRTADGIRAEKVYLCGYTGYPPRKEIDKTALGAQDAVPWEYHENVAEVLQYLKANSIQVVALEHTDNSYDFQTFNYSFPMAIVLGHEYEGLTQEALNQCQCAVEIPMYGLKQSLNVATAFGVIGYELLRQCLKSIEK
jgi:tRNA G18 (ribose-2'-O)-methylase SpoU